jgi:hypothetical protein
LIHTKNERELVAQASQAAEKMSCFVILSEAKNLSSIQVQEKKQGEILRFAQNDSALSFSAPCSACGFLRLQGLPPAG